MPLTRRRGTPSRGAGGLSAKVSFCEPRQPDALASASRPAAAAVGIGLVVPRDRIELSKPGFSAEQTDVRWCLQKSIIVFTRSLETRLASTNFHQCPRTKVSGKVSFAWDGIRLSEPYWRGVRDGVTAPGDKTLAWTTITGLGPLKVAMRLRCSSLVAFEHPRSRQRL
jgi:hypothetical protein